MNTLTLLERARQLTGRVVRLLRSEVEYVQPAKLAAELTTAAMPHLCFNYLRTTIWRAAGLKVGDRSRIMGRLHVTGSGAWQNRLAVGADTFLTGPVRIDLDASVSIGDRVRIGHDVMLLTVNHEIGDSEQRCSANFARPIIIGDGAWLASRCIILPGVSIGKGAVVAAGAVVTRDVPPDTMVAGAPARVVRSFDELAPESVPASSGGRRVDRSSHANALTSRSPALRALS